MSESEMKNPEDHIELVLKGMFNAEIAELEREVIAARKARGGRLPERLESALKSHSDLPPTTQTDVETELEAVMLSAMNADVSEIQSQLNRERTERRERGGGRLPDRLEDALEGAPHPYVPSVLNNIIQFVMNHAVIAAFVCPVAGLLGAGVTRAIDTAAIDTLRQSNAAYAIEVAAMQAKIKEYEEQHPVVPPDSEQLESTFQRGHGFAPMTTDTLGQVILVPPAEFQPPDYVALEVQWEEGADYQTPVHFGYLPTPAALLHQYKLPNPGDTRHVTLTLVYHVSAQAAEEFSLQSFNIVERFPMVLSSSGVRLATEVSAPSVSAKIESPLDLDGTIPQLRFPMRFTVTVPREQLSDGREHVLQVLTRPLDGPNELRQVYQVQPFRELISELFSAGVSREHTFELQIDLSPGPYSSSATCFEVLVVELGFDWSATELPRTMLDLDNKVIHDAHVVAKRTVRVDPPVDNN